MPGGNMSRCTITCPHCGFSKDVDIDPAAMRGKTVNCPKCKKAFPFVAAEPLSPEPLFKFEQAEPAPESNPIIAPETETTPQNKFCSTCGSPIHINAEICPKCGVRVAPPRNAINKVALLLITFFLGGIGGHKFYVKKYLQGVLYLLFFWTYIPSFVAFIEFIFYACKSEEELQAKFPEINTGAIFVVIILPAFLTVVAIVGILAAIAIPQFAVYSQKAHDMEAKTALMSCQAEVVSFYAANGILPMDERQLYCQTPNGVSLYFMPVASDQYELISFSQQGSKAFLYSEKNVDIEEFDKMEIKAELTNDIGAEYLSPGFYFVK
jgi:TM2 domain-containing membrane protein YozV